ncbi:MAG: hypothetical protein U0V70_10450 [Terriglobia bacterium]
MLFKHSSASRATSAGALSSLKTGVDENKILKVEFPLNRHPEEIDCWFDESWKEKCRASGDHYYWEADATDPGDRKQASELVRKDMVDFCTLNGALKSMSALGSDFEDPEFQHLLEEIQKTNMELQKLKGQTEKLNAEEKNIRQVLDQLDDPSLTDKVFEETKKKSYAAELARTKIEVYERQRKSLKAKALTAFVEHRQKEFERRKRIGDQMAERINAQLDEDQKLINEFIGFLPSIATVAPDDQPISPSIHYVSSRFDQSISKEIKTLELGRIVIKQGRYEFKMREE